MEEVRALLKRLRAAIDKLGKDLSEGKYKDEPADDAMAQESYNVLRDKEKALEQVEKDFSKGGVMEDMEGAADLTAEVPEAEAALEAASPFIDE